MHNEDCRNELYSCCGVVSLLRTWLEVGTAWWGLQDAGPEPSSDFCWLFASTVTPGWTHGSKLGIAASQTSGHLTAERLVCWVNGTW